MPNFCPNDEWSSMIGCLLTDSEIFILFAENSTLFLKISVIHILLTFINRNLSVSKQPIQLIIAANNCHNCLLKKNHHGKNLGIAIFDGSRKS